MHPVNTFLAKYRPAELPEPGVYESINFDTYRAWPCVNASLLKAFARTSAHGLSYLTEPRKPSKALKFGSFAHAGRLEPLAIAERYAVMPDYANDPENCTSTGKPSTSPATAWCKERVAEFQLANPGKEIVSQADYDKLEAMNRLLCQDRTTHMMLNAWGPVEVSIVWDDPDTGIRCMARADKLDKDMCRIVDYKTTADLMRFPSSIVNFGYDLQGAWYVDGAGLASGTAWSFAIVAQESAAPYLVQADDLNSDHITAGRELYREALDRFIVGVKTTQWPGYGEPDWRRPLWANKRDQEEQSIGDWLREAGTSADEQPQLENAHV